MTEIHHERHIKELVQVISDILGGQTTVLQRVERGLTEQYKTYHDVVTRMQLLDKKIQGGFTVLENKRLASLDKNVSERLSTLDYTFLMKLKHQVDAIHSKLQQQLNLQLMQLLIKQTKKPSKRVREKTPTAVRPSVGLPTKRPGIPRAPAYTATVPQPTQPVSQEAAADVEDKDWMESELEGAQIFDTIITTWKRRDWESQAKGTKEMFMRAWKKLSNPDRQKIRNGTWSKKIIKKMQLLSRE